MKEDPGGGRPEAAAEFRVLARLFKPGSRHELDLEARGAVALDFLGKALGLEGDARRRLACDPDPRLERLDGLAERLAPLLDALPSGIRLDAIGLVEAALRPEGLQAPPLPLCPACRKETTGRVDPLWTSTPGASLGPLEGAGFGIWCCRTCSTVFECSDRLGAAHRARSFRVRVPGREIEALVRRVRALADHPADVVREVSLAPEEPWILERIPALRPEIWRCVGPDRDRLMAAPETAPRVYAEPHALARLGIPPGDAAWRSLVASPLPADLLARLARLPGTPLSIRELLLDSDDPEVRHQALQSPDFPTALLARCLEDGPPERILSILDRPDAGRRTLELAIEASDPNVLYRAMRHPSVDVLLLERIRTLRRATLPAVLPPTRVLHVYAPAAAAGPGRLMDRITHSLAEAFARHGFLASPPVPDDTTPPGLDPDGGIRLVCIRATLSRILVHLPVVEGVPWPLGLERAVATVLERLTEDVAEEIVELHVDEAGGNWSATVLCRGGTPQRRNASGLAPPLPDEPPGRWLELELFVSDRALPHAGLGVDPSTTRLVTRPPYRMSPDDPQHRVLLRFRPA